MEAKAKVTITSKQFREKIKSQKEKIESIKKSYTEKIDALEKKESMLEMKSSLTSSFSFVSSMSKKSEKQLSELDDLRSQIAALKEERDSKIESEKALLNKLKTVYRDNRDKLAKNDQSILQAKKNDALHEAKHWIKKYKWLVIIVGIIAIFFIIDGIQYSIRYAEEENRDYYVNVDDNFTFDCNIDITRTGQDLYCEDREISGTFSSYDTVKFDWAWNIKTDGDKFTQELNYSSVPRQYYEIDDFNIDLIKRYFDKDDNLSLKNEIMDKVVVNKEIKIRYNLTDKDMEIIAKKHDEWATKKAEEAAKKAEEEAKAQQEAEAKRLQEEEAKRAEDEKKAAEEAAQQAAQQEAERQAAEQQAAQDNGEELPSSISPYDIKALCERGFEDIGYPNASINMTNQYPMGYPPYIYVIVGTLSTKAGWTSSRQQVGGIQCQANWDTWTIKHLSIDGVQIY